MPAILRSHRLADFVLAAVFLLGAWAYFAMPRAQYPEVNLNWMAVAVIWPGAAAQDVEREITLPLEAAARRVTDVRLVTATSRDNVATLLVRFTDVPHGRFERRLVALEREIRQAAAGFPREARPPQILELTSSNFFPTAMVAVSGAAADGSVCRLAEVARDELERLPGVARVWAYGLRERELAVDFNPEALRRHQVSPENLARAVADQAHTYPAGMADVSGRRYAIRVEGLSANPDFLAELPVLNAAGKTVPLAELAKVRQGVGAARELVRLDGKPAVLLSVIKAENVNTLDLTHAVRGLVTHKNQAFGAPVYTLLDDQSDTTREAIGVMETNALFGLAVVLAVTWFFLGGRLALLTSLGVPFALAGMFLALHLLGQTLNVSVLLGVVIVLGIPLDDAVVVADAIRRRLATGMSRMEAVAGALKEVSRPVTASVLATCLAFAPLLLLPGLLGRFMFVTPLTVIVTLGMSLIASLWLLPRHVVAWGGAVRRDATGSKVCCWRERLAGRLRHFYGRALAAAFRHPLPFFTLFGALFLVAGLAIGLEWVKPRWFASDPLRVFNLNLQMPPATGMAATLQAARALEQAARGAARPGEMKASLAMAGLQFTPSEMVLGEHLGQVTLSLAPESEGARPVAEFVAALRPLLKAPGAENISVQVLSADLPMLSSLTLRLSGAPLAELGNAAQDLERELAKTPGFTDVRNDASFSQPRIVLKVDTAAAARAGLDPFKLAALIRLHFESVPVGKVMEGEETLNVVVRGQPLDEAGVRRLLSEPWRLPDGRLVNPGELFSMQFESTPGELRRVNGKRTVSLHASFDQDRVTARQAIAAVDAAWAKLLTRHPGVSLTQGGEMEDVKASLNDLLLYLLLGFILMYAWLAGQFGRLALPLVILATAPMAWAGVAIGLLASGQSITLYTLYGCVALSGVAVNASIVLVSAGEDRLLLGMSPLAAAFHAARRRLVPIIITTLTVIGGLISLATGVGGNSLLWGPLASAIVWGLAVATPLTLFVTPLMHAWLMRRRLRSEGRAVSVQENG
ncbi:MAG: efflux RND transporter permease subunit [Pseudomonadota bacterium]|nr:efflux RND transporter permease subunit [Pseudomonadota bacterium]